MEVLSFVFKVLLLRSKSWRGCWRALFALSSARPHLRCGLLLVSNKLHHPCLSAPINGDRIWGIRMYRAVGKINSVMVLMCFEDEKHCPTSGGNCSPQALPTVLWLPGTDGVLALGLSGCSITWCNTWCKWCPLSESKIYCRGLSSRVLEPRSSKFCS